jgi:hypothetical protein
MFSDGPTAQTAPPAARNSCEETFATQLTNELGTAETPPPTPAQAVVITVMETCTARELLEADNRFSFDVGRPMAKLRAHRLFDGPHRMDLLTSLCNTMPYHATRACRTIDADPR